MITLFISFILMFATCSKQADKELINRVILDTCRTVTDIQVNKDKDVVIIGRLQKFTPWEKGKGAGHMFWDWEIAFPLGGAYPLIAKTQMGAPINFAEFENKNVIVHGTVFFGIIIGDSNPEHQSATGYRIDADRIEIDPNTPMPPLDTCWIWDDIEQHRNRDSFVAGKLIEYIPPHDNSKLGDEKIWDYELQLADGYTIPLTDISKNGLELAGFTGRDVFVKAYILYGIIFGSENTANMVGTRIDARGIYVNEIGYIKPFYELKIKFDLDDFTGDGYRFKPPGNTSSINYEFCIPAEDSIWAEVSKIDPTLGLYKTSKGRSACTEGQWLCIGSSRQANFKEALRRLADLKYVKRISETFWE
jgi:hypothetical protein